MPVQDDEFFGRVMRSPLEKQSKLLSLSPKQGAGKREIFSYSELELAITSSGSIYFRSEKTACSV